MHRATGALLLTACAGTSPPGGAFSALTYNVAGLPEGISGSSPERNMPLIAPLLDAYDLALVQEDFVYHDALDAGASHPYRTEWEPPDERPVGDGLNVFSAFPLGPVERVQWVACHGTLEGASDCLGEKGFLATDVALADGTSLLLVNLHAEAGSGPDDVVARAAGFAQLAGWIDENAAGRALLVGGDTNLRASRPDDEVILSDFLAATGTTDACRALGCGEEHIDRFLFRGGDDLSVAPVAWSVAPEFVDELGAPLSDHPAIHVRFAWEAIAE